MPYRLPLLLAGVLGTLAFGYLAVRNVHPMSVWRALERSNYWWTLPSLAAIALAVLVRVQRWRLLFRRNRRPTFLVATRALLLSYFFNSILPARAGEIARILDLKRRAGLSRAETTATVVIERLF